MRIFVLITLITSLPCATLAYNDWNIPCLSGSCSYDLKNGTVSGTLTIAGSPNAISDITSAAGWTILDCSPNATTQDIRAVCTGNEYLCDHVYQGGAEGTVVRLPQDCGAMPFARVVSEWVHQNQSIPPHINVAPSCRSQGSKTCVRGLKLDTEFYSIDPSIHGGISFSVGGSTVPQWRAYSVASSGQPLVSRSILGDIISVAASDTLLNASSNKTTLNLDKSFTLLDEKITCGDFTGEVNMDVETRVNATVDYGITLNGSLVPPAIDGFSLWSDFNVTLDGVLNVNATATGNFDTGKVNILQFGLPGFEFPGIFSLGPSFNVDVEGIATLDTDVDASIGLTYTINEGHLVFPTGQRNSSVDALPTQSDLQLAVNPSIASQASIEAHIIPSIQFGISVLEGLAEANVDLDLDTSAKLSLSLQAEKMARLLDPVSGCVDLSSMLDINAGADASFLDFFDKSTSITLFSKTFDLFQKCFGGQSRAKRRRLHARDILRRGITCSNSNVSSTVSIVDQVISF